MSDEREDAWGLKRAISNEAVRYVFGVLVLLVLAVVFGWRFCVTSVGPFGALFCPPPIETPAPLDWTVSEVSVLAHPFSWHPCPGENRDRCARWNAIEHNGGDAVQMRILRSRQDGTWLDDAGLEHTGLDVGQLLNVTGITVRRTPE